MSAFPKSAIGLISLFIFVAWLVFMLNVREISEPLTVVNEINDETMNRIQDASTNIISGDEGLFGLGIISSVVSLIGNVILAGLLFFVSIFVSLAAFISVLLLIPIQISGLILTLISIGFVMSLLKFIIPE